MTILSGYSSSLPTDVLLGSMVIYIDGAAAYGATDGEPTTNLPHDYENMNFDGKIGIPIAGLDRRVWSDVFIDGVFMELNDTKAADIEPDGTTATAGTGGGAVLTVTPALYGEFLTSAAYKDNVRAVCRRGGGGIVAVEFDKALMRVDNIVGAGTGSGKVKFRLDARQAADAASLGVAPYSIKTAASVAAIVALDG